MQRFYQLLFFIILLQTSAIAQPPPSACNQSASPRMRIIGDSWAHFPVIYQAYDSAMAKYGFADYYSLSGGSVLISMTAETWWQFPLARFALEAAINSDAGKPIEVVMVSLGGNDVAFGIRKGDSLNVLDDDLLQAKLFMDSIFDFIHLKYPNAQIIWQSYDYPNFNDPCLDLPWNPYCDLWHGRGDPTPYEINRFMAYMTDFQDSVVQAYQKPYIHFYNLLGSMQWWYGQTTPLRYEPYGTYPPRSVTLPYGNMNYPSPLAAMGLLGNDTYHLGPQSYTYFLDGYMRKFISNYFRRERDTTIYSAGQTLDGWVSENSVTGIGEVLVGKRNGIETKGIFSFNTDFIPDNKIIKKASLFFKCKNIEKLYPLNTPFLQTFRLDIKTGTFGSEAIEASDFNEVATMNDVACFAGKLRGIDYALRADIRDEDLQYINKTGITQFRLEVSDSNLITFFNGDTTAFEGPYLDIYYDTLTITTPVINHLKNENNLNIYPNPATTTLTLLIDDKWINQEIQLTIYSTDGKQIRTQKIYSTTSKQIIVDINNLVNGGYFINIENEKQKAVGTFIKIE